MSRVRADDRGALGSQAMAVDPKSWSFGRGMRLTGWFFFGLMLLYPVAALEGLEKARCVMPVPTEAAGGFSDLRMVFVDVLPGWFGLQGALWGLVWLLVAAVRWARHRWAGRHLDWRSIVVVVAVVLGLSIVIGTHLFMSHTYGISVGKVQGSPPPRSASQASCLQANG